LAAVPEAERVALFADLVRVARKCLDPPPDEADYRLRFPQFVDQIPSLFHTTASGRLLLKPAAVPDEPLPRIPGY
jgi:hypothetical protein